MKIEIVNQYKQTYEVDNHKTIEVYRTHKTLEQLKEDIGFHGGVVGGEWEDEGQKTVAFGIIQDSMGDINKVNEFNRKPFGKKDYYTLDEIKNADLVWVKGFGIIDSDNINQFEKEFKVSAQKK